MSQLAARLFALQEKIRFLEARFHRPKGSVSLLAVSKSHSIDLIAECAQLGQHAIGENYLQEALPKILALGTKDFIWHFIGPIQSNKTREIAQHFSWVHTVSRLKEATYLSQCRPPEMGPLNICLQIKLDNNPNKSGIPPAEIRSLLEAILPLPQLQLRGLMILPPISDNLEQQRGYFRQLKELFETLNQQGAHLDTLSMGMTHDLAAAIAEGATMVRIGTGLFGPRKER